MKKFQLLLVFRNQVVPLSFAIQGEALIAEQIINKSGLTCQVVRLW